MPLAADTPGVPPGIRFAFDAPRLRSRFPLLADAGLDLHYLDNAATSHKPACVIDAISDCYRSQYGPVHRGLYRLAEQATEAYERARARVAALVGATPAQLVFTRSTTESINLVAQGWVRQRLRIGDEIWVSAMEHHANYLPWQVLCKNTGAVLKVIGLDRQGRLDLNAAKGLFGTRCRLIALSHVSNVLGTVNPVSTIIQHAQAAGIPVLIDGAQAAGHLPVDIAALGCDFYAFSAHKMYGPTGIGALVARPDRLEEMEPLIYGGGMVDLVGNIHSQWMPAPAKFEGGSPNLAGALGFAAAAEFAETECMGAAEDHVTNLVDMTLAGLDALEGVQIYGPHDASERAGIVSFNLEGIHPHDVAQVAAEHDVALRAGHHCCQPLMSVLGEPATVRASFTPYNLPADVEALLTSVKAAQTMFG